MSQQPQIQRLPQMEDVLTVVCQWFDGKPSYVLHKMRKVYETPGGVALPEPQTAELSEEQAFVHLSELQRSMGVQAIIERQGFARAAMAMKPVDG